LALIKLRAIRNLISFTLTPALYALAFGWGLGYDVGMGGVPYLRFLLPGLAAMTIMNHSFGIATEINIARFQNHYFEEYLLSPVWAGTIVLGEILYGASRGICSFLAIVLLGAISGQLPQSILPVIAPAVMTGCMFSAMGVWLALLVRSHRDMNFVSSFVITPMSFVAGTFFSLDRLPHLARIAASLLPLSPASGALRAAWLGGEIAMADYLLILGYTLVFFLAARFKVRKAIP
jgi:ABC-type polysaccharide/polyol phosphate export permease